MSNVASSIGRQLRFVWIALACFGVVVACKGSDALTTAGLEAGCSVNTDCNAPLVCAFRTCHQECIPAGTDGGSRDCPNGEQCLASDRPYYVCQNPNEKNCAYNSDCPSPLLCAADLQCRDQCATMRDCAGDQMCLSGSCVDNGDPHVTDAGMLVPPTPEPDASAPVGTTCSYNSDCPTPLICRANGLCGYECIKSVDCAIGQNCTNFRCAYPSTGGVDSGGGACVPATCGARNCGTIVDGCGSTISCGGNCPNGQQCGGGGMPNVCGVGTCVARSCQGFCGTISDGCSGILICGGCPSGETCGGGGTANECGCTPDNETACHAKNCGIVTNNCGQSVSCGSCNQPQNCGTDDVCACTKITCASVGATCGTIVDGCGGTLNCGTCTSGTCGGNGKANTCGMNGCTPTTSCPAGTCGTISNACDDVITCPACTGGQTCGGGDPGTANQCGCTKTSCIDAHRNCGALNDGCGTMQNCGTCSSPQTCSNGVCGCTPTTCSAEGKNCGGIGDGCGGELNCGTCTGGQICGAGGVNICGTPSTTKSCAGNAYVCGVNDSCCATGHVIGGTFNRENDQASGGKYPAKVASFTLDVYEVTISRFRKFLLAGNGLVVSAPASGAGVNPNISNQMVTGWDSSWNQYMATNLSNVENGLHSCGSRWTDTPGNYETYPIECVTWYEAQAFCIWDGGRLPTESEWLYAARGGAQYRYEPWSTPATNNAFDCSDDNLGGCNTQGGTEPVGINVPNGDGLFGQRNMYGNVREWTFDAWSSPYYFTDCSQAECVDVTSESQGIGLRSIWGAAFNNGFNAMGGVGLMEQQRNAEGPTSRDSTIGFRCAHDP